MSSATFAPAPWQHEQAGQIESVETLVRRTHSALAAAGIMMSPAKVSRRIRARVQEYGRQDFEAWFLDYADPTGETAIRNIMAASR
jgi:hypothetical protein